MKKFLPITLLICILSISCDNEVLPLPHEQLEIPEQSKRAIPTSDGSILFSKYGVNLNNSYVSADNSKTDWKKFLTYEKNLTTALTNLEAKVVKFKIYRVGFSRNMAADTADLAQWIAALKIIAQHGNKLIIAFWGENDYTQPNRDAKVWKKVVAAISQDPTLVKAIKGWELANEPIKKGATKLGGYYTKIWKSVPNWYGKKIILDGGAYAIGVSKNLVNDTKSIKNRLWAVHAYNNYINRSMKKKYGTDLPNLTSKQWKNEYISFFNKQYKHIKNNYIVTELGVSDNYVQYPSTRKEKKIRGFIAACDSYFSQKTTVFWYSGYHFAKIGLVSTNNGAVRANSKNALTRIFF